MLESGLQPVVIESNEAMVVKWINDDREFYSNIGLVLLVIRMLQQLIRCASVCFVPILANQVAHHLAKLALVNVETIFGWRTLLHV